MGQPPTYTTGTRVFYYRRRNPAVCIFMHTRTRRQAGVPGTYLYPGYPVLPVIGYIRYSPFIYLDTSTRRTYPVVEWRVIPHIHTWWSHSYKNKKPHQSWVQIERRKNRTVCHNAGTGTPHLLSHELELCLRWYSNRGRIWWCSRRYL